MTAQPVATASRDRGTYLLLLVAGLVAVAGVAFAVGRVTAPTPVAASSGRGFGNGGFGGFANGGPNASAGGARAGAGRAFGLGGGGAAIRGTVQSVTSSSITLQLANGSTATIDLSGTTTFHKQAAATSSDVTPGTRVQVEVQFQPRTPGSSPEPQASGAPRTFTASDITIVTP